MDLSRAAAEALDAADPLAGFRERFAIADEHLEPGSRCWAAVIEWLER